MTEPTAMPESEAPRVDEGSGQPRDCAPTAVGAPFASAAEAARAPDTDILKAARARARRLGDLLDARNLPIGATHEFNLTAILAGAADWAAFKADPGRYGMEHDEAAADRRAEDALRYLKEAETGHIIGAGTFGEILHALPYPIPGYERPAWLVEQEERRRRQLRLF